jgi:hypothetical protein
MGLLKSNGVLNNFLLWLGVIDQPLEILHTNLAVYIGICYAPPPTPADSPIADSKRWKLPPPATTADKPQSTADRRSAAGSCRGRKLVIALPYLWLILLFLLPFLIVFKISLAEMARAIPPYTELLSPRGPSGGPPSHRAKPPVFLPPAGGSNVLIALSLHRQNNAAIGIPAQANFITPGRHAFGWRCVRRKSCSATNHRQTALTLR